MRSFLSAACLLVCLASAVPVRATDSAPPADAATPVAPPGTEAAPATPGGAPPCACAGGVGPKCCNAAAQATAPAGSTPPGCSCGKAKGAQQTP